MYDEPGNKGLKVSDILCVQVELEAQQPYDMLSLLRMPW
jgi:hypothetical protein